LSTRKAEKIGKVAGFGLNSRKSLRKAKPLFGYFRAFWVSSGIAVKPINSTVGWIPGKRPLSSFRNCPIDHWLLMYHY